MAALICITLTGDGQRFFKTQFAIGSFIRVGHFLSAPGSWRHRFYFVAVLQWTKTFYTGIVRPNAQLYSAATASVTQLFICSSFTWTQFFYSDIAGPAHR
jgi:hypothetical protein